MNMTMKQFKALKNVRSEDTDRPDIIINDAKVPYDLSTPMHDYFTEDGEQIFIKAGG